MLEVRCPCGMDWLVDESRGTTEHVSPRCGERHELTRRRVATGRGAARRRQRVSYKRLAALRKDLALRLADRVAVGAAIAMLLTIVMPWMKAGNRTVMSWDILAGGETLDVLWLLGSWLGAAVALIVIFRLRGHDRAGVLLFLGSVMVLLLLLEMVAGNLDVSFAIGNPTVGLFALLLAFAALLAGHARLRLGDPARLPQAVLAALAGGFAAVSGILLLDRLSGLPARLRGPIDTAAAFLALSLALVISGAIAGLFAARGGDGPVRVRRHGEDGPTASRPAHRTGPTRASVVLFHLSFVVLGLFLILFIPVATGEAGTIFLGLNLLVLCAGPFVLLGIGILDRLPVPRPPQPAPETGSPPAPRPGPGEPPAADRSSVAARLAEADRLRAAGAISADEHAAVRERILSEL